MKHEMNSSWQNRAELAIAHGALTNSKRPRCLVNGVYPAHLTKARGAWVWDTENKGYLDFICGLGSNILGYGNAEVADAITVQALNGATLSLGTTLEVQTAEKVKEIFPFIDRLRFLKTGTDACAAAIRISRAATGRGAVLSEGYHGWSEGFVSLTPPALGVVGEHGYQKFTSLEQVDSTIAAVIIEPIMLDHSAERVKWLQALREKCTKTGTVLIFDEVITGFRFPKLSVANFYNIQPDLICLGKAMANGMPISVVGGKKELMECGEYFVSSTFAGETLSLAAALKTMTLLQTKYKVDYLWEKGEQLRKGISSLWPEKLWIEGYPSRGAFKGDDLIKALFWQEACRAGILFGPSWFFNFSHIEVIDRVLNTSRDIITRLKTGSVQLLGEMPQTPFAQKVRG